VSESKSSQHAVKALENGILDPFIHDFEARWGQEIRSCSSGSTNGQRNPYWLSN